MKDIILFVLLFLPLVKGQSQVVVKGTIVDANSSDPIPYVNIGLLGKNKGTVSDEKGYYSIKASSLKDTVGFSAIGFGKFNITVAELKQDGNIKLVPRSYTVPEVEVLAEKLGKEKIYGFKIKKRKNSVSYGSAQLGTEMGARIRIGKKTLIKSAHFTINHAKGDSMFFRLNLYSFKYGRIGENLLKENIIIERPQQAGILSVDLTPYQIILDQDVLLSLEWIRNDGDDGNEGISFRCSLIGVENAYTKETSQAPFQKISDLAWLAPGIQLSFYLIGNPIK